MSERKLLDLLEKEEIRTLRLNYSQLLDSGQIHKMEEVFTSDARVEVTVGEMNGIEQIKQGLPWLIEINGIASKLKVDLSYAKKMSKESWKNH